MHWRIRSVLGVAVMVLATLSLTGCYEDVTPVNYEPGVYKGADDPLLAKLRGDELHNELAQRVDRAFTDR